MTNHTTIIINCLLISNALLCCFTSSNNITKIAVIKKKIPKDKSIIFSFFLSIIMAPILFTYSLLYIFHYRKENQDDLLQLIIYIIACSPVMITSYILYDLKTSFNTNKIDITKRIRIQN